MLRDLEVRSSKMRKNPFRFTLAACATVASAGLVAVFAGCAQQAQSNEARVLRGRQLVIDHGCAFCHGGADPASEGWLAGWTDASPPRGQDYIIGDFHTYPRNLTPDNTTGLGRFSERQIFNALRFGLRPGETPDVEISSRTPGQGNFPEHPKYLALPMPWWIWRHMSDEDLWSIAAYLKHGLKPVRNKVPDSDGPPDFWAGVYAAVTGPYPVPSYPTANEQTPRADNVDRDRVLRGRELVIHHGCGDCHGGFDNPAAKGWMTGMGDSLILVGPREAFDRCTPAPGSGCYRSRPRNLTPDSLSGLGRFTDRQIFNALRYGLRPEKTPDVEITSNVPGQGNFPHVPNYLAPDMIWRFYRHMSDDDLWAIIAYLRHGVRPLHNNRPPSEEPSNHWAEWSTVEKIGRYPAPPFPTFNELTQRPLPSGGRP